MGPPKYGDLGKQASDVFGKGYHFGLLKLEVTLATFVNDFSLSILSHPHHSFPQVKTKTDTGVEFTSGGSSNIDSGKVAGNLETKYKVMLVSRHSKFIGTKKMYCVRL